MCWALLVQTVKQTSMRADFSLIATILTKLKTDIFNEIFEPRCLETDDAGTKQSKALMFSPHGYLTCG
jgi:hypothetical protein